eukprot:TRINITY_DN75719_c0_g1_i1.p2 TRINITY_DN75719_c0_g1~~TRINITY_DN75719_c0_g1_i1.p2  ORF type:complete len:242 (+),score=69.40 TRINITY_DN75719_c0_g1_i1:87-812(+)
MQRDWGSHALPFLAVGRVEDGVILAYHSAAETSESEELNKDVFRKLLGAATTKLSHGQRTRLAWNEGSVCCLMDQQGVLLYCVVTSLVTYPERLAYQLLYDLVVAVQQVDPCPKSAEDFCQNGALQPRMKELVEQYEDPANFPAMQDKLGDSAVFHSGSQHVPFQDNQALQEAQSKKNMRYMMFGVAILVFVLLCIFVLPKMFGGGGGDDKKEDDSNKKESGSATAFLSQMSGSKLVSLLF